MKRALSLAFAFTVGLTAAICAQNAQSAPPSFGKGTPVVLVGWISSKPKSVLRAHEHKMQVAVGPNMINYTLHLKHAPSSASRARRSRSAICTASSGSAPRGRL